MGDLPSLRAISVDYAVMEHVDNIMIPAARSDGTT